jgi:pimeloyl-ACP methyl ester carboxylesterase
VFLIFAAVIAAFVLVAKLSGHQRPIDIEAATAKQHDLQLDSRMIETNGTRLHVVQAGPPDGPPVILLHGYPEFWWAWHEQIARLAHAGFRVITPDQRGYNGSDKPAGIEAYRMEMLTGDIIGLMDSLGIQQANLVGHDWGGAVAWWLAAEHPQRFRKLVMFNAPHPRAFADLQNEPQQEKTVNWYRTFFQLPWLPELVGRLGNWGLLAKNLRDSSRPGTFSDTDLDYYRYAWDRDDSMHAMVNWYRAGFRYPHDIPGDGTVAIPTRIVWGMRDRFFDSRLGGMSVRHCDDASLMEVPDAGHWILHEEPDLTSGAMIRFFQETQG